MKKARFNMIVAVCSENNVIGTEDNKLPWHISADLKNFRKITTGHPIIMGRKTWEIFGGRPLPGRTHIVITSQDLKVPEGVIVVHSLYEAFDQAREIDDQECFIIGGGEIYQQTMSLADRLYITLVDGNFEGVARFPENWQQEFPNKIHEEILPDEHHKATFMIFDK